MLLHDEPSVLRLLGEHKEPALLAPFSAFTTIDQAEVHVKITGYLADEQPAGDLLLVSPDLVDTLDEFLTSQNLANRRPTWIGWSQNKLLSRKDPPHTSLGGQDGELIVRYRNGRVASFALYPVQSSNAASRLQPVAIKLAEPKGNLRARSQWFQRRTGREKS